MAWEHRGGRLYYYSATKRDGRVIKSYHGNGTLGRLAAGAFDDARRRKVEQSRALASERDRLARPESALRALDDACRLMIEAILFAHGYHRCEYHWRRRRARAEDPRLAQAACRG